MPERVRSAYYQSIPLLIAIGLVWTVFFALLIYRAYTVTTTDERLCNFIRAYSLRGGQPGTPGSAGYAYYKDHPDELKAAIARYREVMQLDCANLPTSSSPGGD